MKHWLLIVFALAAQLGAASLTAEELVPEDQCVLELDLPEGATAKIGGKDNGNQRRIVLSYAEPNEH